MLKISPAYRKENKVHHSTPFFSSGRSTNRTLNTTVPFFNSDGQMLSSPSLISGGTESPVVQAQKAPDGLLNARRFKNDTTLELVIKNLYTLKKGRTGSAVKKIQRALIDAGFSLEEFGPDAIYGNETSNAVVRFQDSKGLPKEQQDGKIGPITMGLLDAHFASNTKQGLLNEQDNTNPQFFGVPPMNPRYSNPAFLSIKDEALRLDGPSLHFEACAVLIDQGSPESENWDVGHVQDLLVADTSGIYSDNHLRKFISPLPIRDTAPVAALFPWYNSTFVREIKGNEKACAFHVDFPGVQFTLADEGAHLKEIRMRFKAVDWFLARNRNSGRIVFIHHAKWGFDLKGIVDTSILPDVTDGTGGLVISKNIELPEPEGTNDTIEHGPGMGTKKPTMTEGVFNEEAKLV